MQSYEQGMVNKIHQYSPTTNENTESTFYFDPQLDREKESEEEILLETRVNPL